MINNLNFTDVPNGDAAKESIYKQWGIDYAKQEHIIQHKKYTPSYNDAEIRKRVAPYTMFVERKDVFDITHDKFVMHPIMRGVELSDKAKKIANELIEIGFTDNITLGKAPALELMLRLQDICNGFEPVRKDTPTESKTKVPVEYVPFSTNPKIEELMELLEEIDVTQNQVVVWSSRKVLLHACMEAFNKAEISYAVYDGDQSDQDKENAARSFQEKETQVFLANQSSGAYGLNCLANASYAIYMCYDGSVEKDWQSRHRLLRGELKEPKFVYRLYAKGSVEERQVRALNVGQELITGENTKEKFTFL
jgi:SNF2 family DNA or RNA helicase